VTFSAAGTNIITSTAAEKAGIECSLDSNITIEAFGQSSLFVTGGDNSAGIGTSGNGTCGWVTILNGSIDSRGATGIGTGWGEYGTHSKLEGVEIYGGSIWATGTVSGSEIGGGLGHNANSTVWNLTIFNGNITASSSSCGSGIGSGQGRDGNSIVRNLRILNGNITASSSFLSSGIGNGNGAGAIRPFGILR
jgi:hypothetical protein